MADVEETMEVLIKLHSEGEESSRAVADHLKDIKDALKDLQEQAKDTNHTLEEIAASSYAGAAAMVALSDANQQAKNASAAAAAATGQQNQGLWATIQAIPVLGGMLTGLSAVLIGVAIVIGLISNSLLLFGGQIALFAGYIVLTTTYLVGMTAVLLVFVGALASGAIMLGLVGGLLGGMAVAVVMLADRLFTTGKILSDPMLGLENNLNKMADTWGQKALPMANQIIGWLNSLIPLVTQAGTALLNWFGPRLPEILKIGQVAVNDLTAAFQKYWGILSPVIDAMIKSAPQWEAFFNLLLQLAAPAVQWLLIQFLKIESFFAAEMPRILPIVQTIMRGVGEALTGLGTNLASLSGWFITRLPQIEPIATSVLGHLGGTFQGIAQAAGHLVDWFIANWPEINRVATKTWNDIKTGWDELEPVLAVVVPYLIYAVVTTFDQLVNHGQMVHDILVALGFILVVVAVALVALGVAVMAVLSAGDALWTGIHNLMVTFGEWHDNYIVPVRSALDNVAMAIGGVIVALAGVPGAFLHAFGPDYWSGVLAALARVGAAIDNLIAKANLLAGALSHLPGGGGGGGGGGGAPGPPPQGIGGGGGGQLFGIGGATQINVFMDSQLVGGVVRSSTMNALSQALTRI